ncbi:MAG: hypothetical protein HY826_06105 [Actinobacteria bacterium]|nr:hypothetical protein [Actinomycetota bacterium]
MSTAWRSPTILLATSLMAATACAGGDESASSTTTTSIALSTIPPTAATPTTTTTTPPPVIDPYSIPGWVAAENLLAGTTDWRIIDGPESPQRDTPLAWIEGYADTTSAHQGQTVTLFVETPAETFRAQAFRMGWYGGAQARLIWESPSVTGGLQGGYSYQSATGMAEGLWAPSLTFDITGEWPPGAYLLKLVSSGGGAHYVPLTIRHDAAAADLLFMSAVTTWQAYNPWGGCTLYQCFGRSEERADIVSFDRPYAYSYGQGAADFTTHEVPLVSFIEELGLDVAYITNIDLHREPLLASSRKTLISSGHDEYYSAAMRAALVDALAVGSNMAFFGANAIYRNIRLEPSDSGTTDRRVANYRRASDPGASDDPQTVTVDWYKEPLNRNEAEIVGIEYGCANVHADMQLVNTGNWVYEGTGATDGQILVDLVGVEFDELAGKRHTAENLEILAASPLVCGHVTYQQVTAYRSTPAGGGVFAAGTINWGCGLDGSCPGIERMEVVRGVTANVLRAFAAGPAGAAHPSVGNVAHYRRLTHQQV